MVDGLRRDGLDLLLSLGGLYTAFPLGRLIVPDLEVQAASEAQDQRRGPSGQRQAQGEADHAAFASI